MANLPISQLPLVQAGQLDENDVFAVVNLGTTKKVTLQSLASAVFLNGTGTVGDAQNGLHVSNGKVELGGTLSYGTYIDQNSNDLKFGNGNFLSEGFGNAAYPVLNPTLNQKLIWSPTKYAFRAGFSNNGEWDVANVGAGSVAFGRNNIASGESSFAHGSNSTATGYNSFAIGNSVRSHNSGSLAAGDQTFVLGSNAVAFGFQSIAKGASSIAVGDNAVTGDEPFYPIPPATGSIPLPIPGSNAIAVGRLVRALGVGSIAIGNGSLAQGMLSTALGDNVKAYGVASFAQGCGVEAGNPNGYSAQAWAIGTNSKAYSTLSFAFGYNAKVGIDNEGQIIESTNSFSFGHSSVAIKPNSFSFGAYTEASETCAFAFGDKSKATGIQSLAFGYKTESRGIASIGFGTEAISSGNGSFAVGNNVLSSGKESFAQGFHSSALGNQSIALGCEAIAGDGALGQAAISIGDNTKALNHYSLALGAFATASGEGSAVIGKGVRTVNGSNQVQISPLVNNIPDSLAIGFNSNLSTLFVGASTGTNTTGKVGIGNTNPSAKLDVSGDFKLQNGAIVNEITTVINKISPSDSKLVTEKAVVDLVAQDAGGNVVTTPFTNNGKLIITDTTSGSTSIKESNISVETNNLLGVNLLGNKLNQTTPLESQITLGQSELSLDFNGLGISIDATKISMDVSSGAGGKSLVVGANLLTVNGQGKVGIGVENSSRDLGIKDIGTGFDGSATTLDSFVGGDKTVQNKKSGTGALSTKLFGTLGVKTDPIVDSSVLIQAGSGTSHVRFNGTTTPTNLVDGDMWVDTITNVGPRLLYRASGNTYNLVNPNTVKGQIAVHDGTTNKSLTVGANGQVLVADSAEALGVKWASVSSVTKPSRYLDFCMSGQANSTVGLLAKGASTDNNPSAIPTTTPNNLGIQNGGNDPYLITRNSKMKSIQIAFGQASVGTGTKGSNVKARFQLYKMEYSTRTLLGTFDVPVNNSTIGVSNNLSVSAFQSAGLDSLSTQLNAGDLIGLQFTNVSNDDNLLNAIGRLYVTIETEMD